jgi:hypothetical protein
MKGKRNVAEELCFNMVRVVSIKYPGESDLAVTRSANGGTIPALIAWPHDAMLHKSDGHSGECLMLYAGVELKRCGLVVYLDVRNSGRNY